MKKILIVVVMALFAINASAQSPFEKAIGLRLGSGVGVDYKQFISDRNALEFIGSFGLTDPTYITVTGLYEWEWNLTDDLYWFVGPGATLGAYSSNFNVALNGIVGLEYKFDIPLTLGIDASPAWYFLNSAGFGWSAALTVRYCF